MNSTTIAVDVAKSVFEVVVSVQPGHLRDRQRLSPRPSLACSVNSHRPPSSWRRAGRRITGVAGPSSTDIGSC
jgi:hypothetical protein